MVSEHKMIRLNLPYTDHHELEEIAQVLKTGYLTQGPKVVEFENLVSGLVGSKYAFATSSCTTALHLSLAALGIGPGDEVLVADFTFPATANVVVQQGAKPVLVDIELSTYTMSPDDLQSKITPRAKAIIPVHTFGCSADMDPIMEIANRYGLAVIEDAACAISTTYKNRYCGSIGTIGCFSFHPRKVITTGEGGMIVTDNPGLSERIRLLRSHGGARIGHWFQYEAAGFNYRLSDILGAIGVAQMQKLSWIIERKRLLASKLIERLAGLSGIHLPTEPPWGGHIYQSFVIRLDSALNRNQIIESLRLLGIEATLGTYALHDQPFYQQNFGYAQGQLPNSHIAFEKTVSLPLYPQLTEQDLDVIANGLKEAIRSA